MQNNRCTFELTDDEVDHLEGVLLRAGAETSQYALMQRFVVAVDSQRTPRRFQEQNPLPNNETIEQSKAAATRWRERVAAASHSTRWEGACSRILEAPIKPQGSKRLCQVSGTSNLLGSVRQGSLPAS